MNFSKPPSFPEKMSSENSNAPKIFPPPPQLNLQQAFSNLQHHCSNLLNHLPNPSSFKIQLQSALSDLQQHARHALDPKISGSSSGKNPVWARVAGPPNTQRTPVPQSPGGGGVALSTEAIEERLAGVPVYALSNANDEFVLVSGVSNKKSLGLFCFKKEDAEALLEHIKSMDPSSQSGSKVVAVALNKVFQLKHNGVAFRLIPESSQVENALRVMEQVGFTDDGFTGVPVFQEDLENSLLRAAKEQNQINPAYKRGNIQVAVLEEVLKGMKESSTPNWDDVVFIPPGFDISTRR
ncbi:hypothetical protein I3842_01G111700 [Carya illinoinensis]|uniref:Protein TIC 22-like, chloroplastic n=1 Tax=Carya illinoinensis TaxID=32201 RepID=A0A922G235_CARIL|nr:hypothetical protein I3842_01G111700 [Carya illinoinensis]